jgi:hypothetical protein
VGIVSRGSWSSSMLYRMLVRPSTAPVLPRSNCGECSTTSRPAACSSVALTARRVRGHRHGVASGAQQHGPGRHSQIEVLAAECGAARQSCDMTRAGNRFAPKDTSSIGASFRASVSSRSFRPWDDVQRLPSPIMRCRFERPRCDLVRMANPALHACSNCTVTERAVCTSLPRH